MPEHQISVRELHPALGAEIVGVDLSVPTDPELAARLSQLWSIYHVLLFRGQSIDDPDQIRFSRHFGELEVLPERDQRAAQHPEIFRIANTDEGGRIRVPDDPVVVYLNIVQHWHTDSAYRQIPSLGAILRALDVPPSGGETLFANLFLAYEEMPDEMKARIRNKVMRCSYEKTRRMAGTGLRELNAAERARTPCVFHSLVRRHPDRGDRLSLYLSPVNMEGIVDMADDEAAMLVEELTAWATQGHFVYEHRWQVGDVLMWDNRCTMHQVLPYDRAKHRRVMHRTALAGVEPVIPLANVS